MGIPLGGIIPIQLQLANGETSLFPLAHVYDASMLEISGSPVALSHVANGLYVNDTLTMPSTAFVVAQYIVFNDSGHTTRTPSYQISEENFEFLPSGNIMPDSGNLVEIVGYVVQSVGPVNNSPIPDQQILNIVQGEDFTIQVRLKNLTNFQPYYLGTLASPHGLTAQFLNSDGTTLSVDGSVSQTDDSLVQFPLSNAQTAGLMLGNAQSFQVSFTQIINAQNVKTVVPMNNSLNITATL